MEIRVYMVQFAAERPGPFNANIKDIQGILKSTYQRLKKHLYDGQNILKEFGMIEKDRSFIEEINDDCLVVNLSRRAIPVLTEIEYNNKKVSLEMRAHTHASKGNISGFLTIFYLVNGYLEDVHGLHKQNYSFDVKT